MLCDLVLTPQTLCSLFFFFRLYSRRTLPHPSGRADFTCSVTVRTSFFFYSSYHAFVLLSSVIVFFQGPLLSHTAIMYNQTWLNVVNASYNRIIVLVPHSIRESCRESGHEAKLPHTHHSSSGFDGIAITDSTPYCIADGEQPLNDRRIFFLW